MVVHRRRRWSNIKPASDQCILLAARRSIAVRRQGNSSKKYYETPRSLFEVDTRRNYFRIRFVTASWKKKLSTQCNPYYRPCNETGPACLHGRWINSCDRAISPDLCRGSHPRMDSIHPHANPLSLTWRGGGAKSHPARSRFLPCFVMEMWPETVESDSISGCHRPRARGAQVMDAFARPVS